MTVRVNLRINLENTTFRSSVLAESIASAVDDAKSYWKTTSVSVIFPLDNDFFVADTSEKEVDGP